MNRDVGMAVPKSKGAWQTCGSIQATLGFNIDNLLMLAVGVWPSHTCSEDVLGIIVKSETF